MRPQTRPWAMLLFVVIACVALAAFHKRAERTGGSDPVVGLLRRAVLVPPARVFGSLHAAAGAALGGLFHGPRLARENRRLEAQVAHLSLQNRDLADEAAENVRLRKLLDFKNRSQAVLLAAQVIAFKPSALRDTMILSRGYRNGVTRKMPVLDPSGALVGQVIDVTPDTCDVMLLTDNLSSAGVVVVPAGRPAKSGVSVGICQGERAPLLNLIDLPQQADIKVGDTVITSGLGGVYPREIPVGVAKTVQLDPASYQTRAQIAPDADLNHLQEAFLLKSPS